MKKEYGKVLHSIPIDLDLGCPNRDSDGSGGCTFCPENGARSAQSMDAKTLEEQIIKSISFAKKRYKAKHFMLYIQAYTGTFTSLKQQKETYTKLLKLYNFDAISIGTRPDCLSLETLEYLKELNKEISVSIDLGIQSFNDKTLESINRGHTSTCSIEAIKKLQEYGLKVFAHMIVGLPNESRDDWSDTAQKLVDLKVDGIKIHNLHVVKNTQLHVEYEKSKFKTYNEYEYAEELIHLLKIIPQDMPILRLSTDTPDKNLVAPIWHMEKGQFGEYIFETLQYRYGKSNIDDKYWSKKYKDYYYPKSGAIKQANELFISCSKLIERLTCKDIKLLDIGFGFGINSLEALKIKTKNALHVTALDQDASIVNLPLKDINFIVGDIRYTLGLLREQYDVIFLDPFCEDKNASMVSLEIIKILKKLLHKNGIMVSSTSLHVTRIGLSKAGFKSEIVSNADIKGLIVTHGNQSLKGEPYLDPYLVYRDKQIDRNKQRSLLKTSL